MARDLGYLVVPDSALVMIDQALKLPPEQIVLMGTGSQGEPSSIMGRLAMGTNRHFDLIPGDTVVLSSHPIPGNEESISKVINRLLRRGANVIYDAVASVHVSGHASKEEQKLLINLVKPKHFMPIHGELRQLTRHAALAKQVGIPEDKIIVVENGQVVELADGELRLAERVPGGYVFVEGGSIGEIDTDVMREREQLARGGILLVDLSLDKRSGRLLQEPEFITRGFITPQDAEELMPRARRKVMDLVNGGGIDTERVITDAMRTFLYNETGRRPMVFVSISRS
jgi:ribonuclease J